MQTGTQTGRHRDGQTDIPAGQTDSRKGRQVKQLDRQADRQPGWDMDSQRDRNRPRETSADRHAQKWTEADRTETDTQRQTGR